jgi:hypothetical protein
MTTRTANIRRTIQIVSILLFIKSKEMPGKTMRRGGLFGLFKTTYAPDQTSVFTSSVGTKFGYSVPDKKGQYWPIYSKDGKSWSKLTDPNLPGYREFRQWYKSKDWNSLTQEQKDQKANEYVQARMLHWKQQGTDLTPEQQKRVYDEFMNSNGKPNMLTSLGGRSRRNRRRTLRRKAKKGGYEGQQLAIPSSAFKNAAPVSSDTI